MSDELQPYYLNEGKRLLDTLLSIGLVGVDTENDYNAISEFLGEELQAVADTSMRRATMKLRREQLLASRQEPKPYTEFKELRGIAKGSQSSCTVAGCNCGTSDVPLHERLEAEANRAKFVSGMCSHCLTRMAQEEADGDVFDPTYAQCPNPHCKWYDFQTRSNYMVAGE